MNKVSRSFALVTPCFEEPLDSFMSTAYLICRIVDNIEDSQQSFDWQQERFFELKQLLDKPALAKDILTSWSSEDWIGIDHEQKQLLQPQNGVMLWEIYSLIPDTARAIINRWTTTMCDGLKQVLAPQQSPMLVKRNGISVLATVKDYNQYCYFVAGTVGHMGTELAIDHYKFSPHAAEKLLIGCENCGRALQKTNIIKDFVEDLERGWCYLPDSWIQAEIQGLPLALKGASAVWKQKILMDVETELNESVAYVLNIPYKAVGYRLASLMCLLPAYQTLLLAANSHEKLFTPEHKLKISRNCFSQCMTDAKLMVYDNQALLEYSQDLQKAIQSILLTI
ncbi:MULTISPECIES: squalene/phytoene synthase family protein [Nostoc]|uniref:Squalene/phytoene synthase family protein n=1 Tax=Nostoc paludosum FACHB-159 TaxID=2692908 RepID=A0ABR8KK42_9NOSO|nr:MULTISPECIES: squalene/phytoene synthase family protein [Nostoc]MBD2683629.1 squalene/phytoene synthase family protein [Nostoc sp. FACHB-857]MBD2739954.1 squalene/phytoene synthase family protein [Nostoc paludosum FACHB-159]